MVKGNSVQVYGGDDSSLTSLTLLDKVRRSERAGWERLVSLYGTLVFYWCYRAGLQRADAEEIVQEVFLAVSRSIGAYRHDRPGDSFRGWLRVIFRNKIRGRVIPPGGKGEGGDGAKQLALRPNPDGAAESGFDAEEKAIVYRRAIAMVESSFEPTTRRAFWLVVNGWRACDVAAELTMSVAAVYVAKSRVLSRLREEFDGLVDWIGPSADGAETVSR